VWTTSRSALMHSCPAEPKQARTAPSTARRRFASAATYMVFLPPSSSDTPTSRRPVASATRRPVAVEPVKLT
jgi:hypothetical protein